MKGLWRLRMIYFPGCKLTRNWGGSGKIGVTMALLVSINC